MFLSHTRSLSKISIQLHGVLGFWGFGVLGFWGFRVFLLSSIISSVLPVAYAPAIHSPQVYAQETMTSSNPTDEDQNRFDQLVEPIDEPNPTDIPSDLPPSDESSQD